ncbi:MAG TPA: DUF922 domain-containing protein [Polyangiaceae bacterium]
MRRAGWTSALLVVSIAGGACERAADEPDSDAGRAGDAGAGRGEAGSGAGAGAGGRNEQAGTSGSAGTAPSGGSGGEAGRGTSGRAGQAGQNGSSGAGGGGRAAAGSGGVGGAGGADRGGSAGTGAEAGDPNSAGAAGEPSQPPECADPFDVVDVSNLETSQTLETYTVTGNTANEIRGSIDANREGDYDAFTSWYVSWRFGDCSGGDLVVTADVNYRVPEWVQPNDALPELVTSWETYMDALFCHEHGHAKLGLQAASEIYVALDEIEANGDCGAQQSLAEAAFGAILDDYLEREIRYDVETNHGATMGATFP